MESFLGNLVSYAPRTGRTAHEDFFTEVFAGVLRVDQRLLPAVLRFGHLNGRIAGGWKLDETEPCRVETQFRGLGEGRPDLAAMVSDEPRVIIESKFFAAFTGSDGPGADGAASVRPPQIRHYVNEVVRAKWPAKIVLVSLYPRDDVAAPQHPDVYLGNLLWSDVYQALRSIEPSKDNRARFLLHELLSLMEDLAMTPPKPFRFGDTDVYFKYIEMKEGMRAMLDRFLEVLRRSFDLPPAKSSQGDAYHNYFMSADGLGIDLALIFGSREEANRPVWPLLCVRADMPKAPAAQVALGKVEDLAGWAGKCRFPTNEELSRFLGAWDWDEQVRIGLDIITPWFKSLADAGLIRTK